MTKVDDRLLKYWKKQWTPPKIQTVREWAEEHLYLPSSASPKPGRYSTDTTPHVREPLEAYTDPETTFVILCWAAQSAKTTTELVCKCFNMANYDGNQIFLMPSETMAKSYSETRLQPIIEATPALKDLKPRQRDKYKKLEMHMANGVINLIGGASPANLASRSAGRLFTDEIDKLKAELKNEADPLSLLFERAKWFPDKKIFLTSTPTVPEGHIWVWFEKGTQEHYYVPCPECEEYFTPDWYKDMKWIQDDDEEMSLEERAQTAYLQCPNPECGFHIKDKHKYEMLEEGKWIAHNERATKRMRSFHYNEIMSHITKWSDLVLKFLQAVEKKRKGDLSELKNFINSSLAQPWLASAGHTVNDELIENMIDVGRARGEVPPETKGLVAGIDTQDNGFFYVIRAFGDHNTSWLIKDGFVDTFEALEKAVLQSKFGGRHIVGAFMDCQGHRTDEVYKFCRKWAGVVTPCVGRGKSLSSEYSFHPVDKAPGKQVVGGLMRCVWNTVTIKDLMFAKMRIDHEDPGSFHIHDETTRAYRQALKSEFKNEKGDYEHIRHIPNHLLDCFEEGTEVLTKEGWVDFREYKEGTEVATYNLKNKNLEYQTPLKYINKEYEGDMVHIKTRTLDLKVTPNHRMVVQSKKWVKGNKHIWVEGIKKAKDLSVWDRVSTRTQGWKGLNRSEEEKRYAKQLGWFVAEGYTGRNKVILTQTKEHTVEVMKGDFKEFELKQYKPNNHQFIIHNKKLTEKFKKDGYVKDASIKKSYTKAVPQWVKDSDEETIRAFLEGYLLGDGWKNRGTQWAATTSKKLADDICELAIKLGFRPVIHTREPTTWEIEGRSGITRVQYWVSFCEAKGVTLRKSDNTKLFNKVKYKGKVYCLTVPNGTLIVRKNGKMIICGNCEALTFLGARLRGIEYWDVETPPNTRPETLHSERQIEKPW